jgi:hypothetical protein
MAVVSHTLNPLWLPRQLTLEATQSQNAAPRRGTVVSSRHHASHNGSWQLALDVRAQVSIGTCCRRQRRFGDSAPLRISANEVEMRQPGGRLYAFEKWIADGKALELAGMKKSLLQIALDIGFHSLVELLAKHD